MKYILFGFFFAIAFIFSSCTSQKSSDVASVIQNEENASEKLLFLNWKNRGFGASEPDWIYPLNENDFAVLRSDFSEKVDGKVVVALVAFGNNVDALENKIRLHAFDVAAGKATPVVSSWVKLKESIDGSSYMVSAVYAFEPNSVYVFDAVIRL